MFMYVQVHMYMDALDVVKGQRTTLAVIPQALSTMFETRALINLECNKQTGLAGQEAPQKDLSLGLPSTGFISMVL